MIPYQAWRVVEMNLFTKNIRGFVDFSKQAEPKNPCVTKTGYNSIQVSPKQFKLSPI